MQSALDYTCKLLLHITHNYPTPHFRLEEVCMHNAENTQKKGTETAPLGHNFGKRLPFAKRELFSPNNHEGLEYF